MRAMIQRAGAGFPLPVPGLTMEQLCAPLAGLLLHGSAFDHDDVGLNFAVDGAMAEVLRQRGAGKVSHFLQPGGIALLHLIAQCRALAIGHCDDAR
jgi:hypothetical protein